MCITSYTNSAVAACTVAALAACSGCSGVDDDGVSHTAVRSNYDAASPPPALPPPPRPSKPPPPPSPPAKSHTRHKNETRGSGCISDVHRATGVCRRGCR
ncbi:hypothetical protein QTP88_012720 [Uroleucon formosanum]